jgi:hypothetical protein
MIGHRPQQCIDRIAAQQLPVPVSKMALRGEPQYRPETRCAQELDAAKVQYQGMVDVDEADKVVAD